MINGYLFPGKKETLFFVTSAKRKNNKIASAIIDYIGRRYNPNHPETTERAKKDPATLDTVKKKMEAATMDATETRRRFYTGNCNFFEVPANDPTTIIIDLF